MSELKVIFADVGQGDSTLLQLPDGRNMLVDINRCPGHGIDLFKLLDDVLPDGSGGRKKLDILAISHAHDDHITGIGDLYDRYEVEWLWVPQHEDRKKIAKHFGEFQDIVDKHPEDRVLRPQGSRTPLNDKDDAYFLGDGINVRCFSPPGFVEIDEALTEEEAKQVVHENCSVLRVEFEGTSVLLAGDSDVKCWERIVDYYPAEVEEEVLSSDVLHASHHGSRTFVKEGGKDSDAWTEGLDAIDPEVVVVSVGQDNRHEHPHDDMMSLYRAAAGDENVFETNQTGTIVLTVDAVGAALDADGTYAEKYGWDDEDGDDPGGDDGDGGGGGKAARASARRSPTRLDSSAAA